MSRLRWLRCWLLALCGVVPAFAGRAQQPEPTPPAAADLGTREPDAQQPAGQQPQGNEPIALPPDCPDPGADPFPQVTAQTLRTQLEQAGHPAPELQRWDRERVERGLAGATEALLFRRRPDFAAAVQSVAAGDPRGALELVKVLAASGSDRVLRSHTRYHLGRLFLAAGDPRRAAEIFASHLEEDPGVAALDGEMLFFHGRALADWPAREPAIRALAGFIKWFPGAPWEYRNVALVELKDLLARGSQPLHDVADQMQTVEQALRRGESGVEVRQQQQEITAQLQQMLRRAEQQEQQQSSGATADSQSGKPSEESRLPPGESRIGGLGPTPSVAERWGDLRDAEREAIRAQLSQDLPPHYRRMLEAYYLRLARRGR